MTQEQYNRIEQTAQGILDARALYPNKSLAWLYDEATMPPELREAHRLNDIAVAEAYDIPPCASEAQIVEELFKRYKEMVRRAEIAKRTKQKMAALGRAYNRRRKHKSKEAD